MVLPKIEPEVITDQPQIQMNDMKVEPIVHSEVIDKSPITISHEDGDSEHSMSPDNSSMDSSISGENSNSGDQMSLKSSDLDTHQAQMEGESSDLLLLDPSERSNMDEDTVQIDPGLVNKDKQTVILGDDKSQDLEDKSNILI